jgi:acyl carrier protein
MQPVEFYALLDEILELPPGTIKGDEALEALDTWDSLAVISFIAMVDQHFEIILESQKLMKAGSVGELYALVQAEKVV